MNGTDRTVIVIQALTAFGTIAAVLVALWGEWIRSRFFGPRLRLSLTSDRGSFAPFGDGTPSFWYHLKVSNLRKEVPARAVRVLVTRVSVALPDGSFSPEPLSAPIQVTWDHPELHPMYPTLGPDDTCGFAFVKNGEFSLSTYVVPNNFPGRLHEAGDLELEFIAVAENAESAPLCLWMSWDGEWSDCAEEMSKHLKLRNSRGGDMPGAAKLEDTIEYRVHHLELARLAHQSFEDRRKYEWKVNFSLWLALGSVAYFSCTKGVRIVDSVQEAWLFGGAVFVLYTLYQGLVARGHRMDKTLKHEYMAIADDGRNWNRPQTFRRSVLWMLPMLGFTGLLIVAVMQLLLSVPTKPIG